MANGGISVSEKEESKRSSFSRDYVTNAQTLLSSSLSLFLRPEDFSPPFSAPLFFSLLQRLVPHLVWSAVCTRPNIEFHAWHTAVNRPLCITNWFWTKFRNRKRAAFHSLFLIRRGVPFFSPSYFFFFYFFYERALRNRSCFLTTVTPLCSATDLWRTIPDAPFRCRGNVITPRSRENATTPWRLFIRKVGCDGNE